MSQLLGSNSRTISGSQLLKTGAGVVYGVVVNSHTSGTLKLWDNTAGSGEVLVNTYTFAAGSSVVTFPAPLNFQTGLYATLGGTDPSVTILFN